MSSADSAIKIANFNDYVQPSEKRNLEWVRKRVRDLYEFGGAQNLLHDKDIPSIISHATGNHDMKPYQRMFKGLVRNEGNSEQDIFNSTDITGLDWDPLGILVQPLNSAISNIIKIPLTRNATAIDSMASTKRELDRDFLRNRNYLQNAMQDIAQKLGLDNIHLPSVKNNANGIDISALDLDPNSETELNLYFDIFYKLKPESAIETALDAIEYFNNLNQTTLLETKDHFYYGRSANRKYFSNVTGLPACDYLAPSTVYAPPSSLPDFSDNTFRYTMEPYGPGEISNRFGDKINEDDIPKMFDDFWNAAKSTLRWNSATEDQKRKGIDVVYMEFKAFDVLRIHKKKTASGRTITEKVPFDYQLRHGNGKPKKNSKEESIKTKHPEQTYYAYYIPGTDWILDYGLLEGIYRDKGKESISKFTISIYQSQEKSAVELSIPLLKDAQRAYIKLQHAIIMAKPKGYFYDFKYLRNAVENLEGEIGATIHGVIRQLAHNNIMFGDSDGFSGAQEGNFPPFKEIPGGLGGEVRDYITVIAHSTEQIARLTGINDALTGQQPNPDGLVGLQKLLLQSSVNSIHYAALAVKNQRQEVLKLWAEQIRFIAKNPGSESYRALENIIGSQKMSILGSLSDIALHQYGIKVEIGPNEEQQAEFRNIVSQLVLGQQIDIADWVAIRRTVNFKDAEALLIVREKKRKKEKQQMELARIQSTQSIEQMREQNKFATAKYMADGEVRERYVEAQLKQWIAQFNAQFQERLSIIEGQIKENLQAKRGENNLQKLYVQNNLQYQTPSFIKNPSLIAA